MKIYTRRGDDGTTGLLYGGRVGKTAAVIVANGSVDEAQAALGAVRAEVGRGSELDDLLVRLERELYVLMAELATAPANRYKLTAGASLVTAAMVQSLEDLIDELTGRFPPVTEFVIPGHDRVSAGLDVARTVVRRAEREVIEAHGAAAGSASHGAAEGSASDGAEGSASDGAEGSASQVGPYLNRLSDLVWTMARWAEHGESLLSRRAGVEGPSEQTTP